MEIKKTEKASLESRKTSMFILGVVISVSLILESFEWATADYFQKDYIASGLEELPDEVLVDIDLVQPKQQNVIKTKTKSDFVKIVDDKSKVVETENPIKKVEFLDISDDFLLGIDEGQNGGKTFIDDVDGVFDPVDLDVNPEFPGGLEKMMEFLSKNTVFPPQTIAAGGGGKSYVSFVVDKKGRITDVAIAKSTADKHCDKEAMRVVGTMPNWIPGEVHGRKVKARFILPINFSLKN